MAFLNAYHSMDTVVLVDVDKKGLVVRHNDTANDY